MASWKISEYNDLLQKFNDINNGLDAALDAVVNGRVAPSIDDLRIGSGRKVRAAVLFFDIRGFTKRTGSADIENLKKTLYMLDCVIPMMMHVLYRHGAFVEKNTGDGLMAILGVTDLDSVAANKALDAAVEMFYVLEKIVNPHLLRVGIDPVQARIGIDMGTMIIARIGVRSGTAAHPRNTLTAVGPSANLACKFQHLASTGEIYCGDQIKRNAAEYRIRHFIEKTPAEWDWVYAETNNPYQVWRYAATKSDPVP